MYSNDFANVTIVTIAGNIDMVNSHSGPKKEAALLELPLHI